MSKSTEPTEQEKQLGDAPPADAVERLKGKARESQDKPKAPK